MCSNMMRGIFWNNVIIVVYKRGRQENVQMNREGRTVVRVAILGVLVSALVFALYSSLKSDEVVKVGDKAPNFELASIDGKEVKLSDLRGKTVVLNFWASWCIPCKTEMPALVKKYKEYKDKGVEVLGVNIAESDIVVKQFADQTNIKFPLMLDPDREITKLYNIGPIPTTFFIDKDGRVVAKVQNQMNEQMIDEYIKKAMP